MAQTKEQNHAPAAANASGEKRPRTSRRPHYTRRPRRPQQPKEAATPIHIYPLGGLGEVGKNMTVYECCGDMIIVDCGLVFPDNDMFGVDMVIPDFTFVVQNKDKIKGLLITHGHEDHIGSIPYLLQKFDLPIYGTRLTCGLIRNKLEEFGLAGKTKFVEITPRQKLKLGCFTVEPIHVNHSIPDAVAFAIDSPAGTIIQTGDFKIDYTPLACGPTDLATLSEYGQKGVLALLSKKLLVNSVGALFDLLAKTGSRDAIRAASNYLSTALYVVYRHLYQANPDNNPDFFSVSPQHFHAGLADADMKCSQAELEDALAARVKEKGPMPAMSNDDLVKSCPTLYPSLLQVVHSAGERVAALLPPRQSGKK